MRRRKCLSVLLAFSLASACMLPAMDGRAAGSGDAKPQILSDDDSEWQEFLNDTSWWNRLSINGVGEASLISNPDGGTLQLEVTEQPYLNVVTDQVEWSIDKPKIAEISDQGLVTAKKAGTVTVTAKATLNGTEKSGQLTIDILDKKAAYQDNFDDIIAEYEVPEWFRDAKFGVFVHWGVYSVPAYYSEWLPHEMYRDGWVRDEIVRRYGPLSEKGYKDFLRGFTAENYDPDAWADLFEAAGAKYVVPVAEHHDGIPMYDSKLTRWNVANVGPKEDLLTPLTEAIRSRGMRLGLSNHYLENEQYYDGAKAGDDASDPRWFDLYNNAYTVTQTGENNFNYSSTHMQMWYNRSKEMIDKFSPDLVYYDWTIDQNRYTEQMLSYYYNRARKTNPDGVVVNYKHNLPDGCAVYDIERGQSEDILPMAWQTCTSISNLSWGYIENDSYKQPLNLINLLIDVVSKNGNLLLNVGPDKTGTIPPTAEDTFRQIGKWLETNGEGIYATRPWSTFGEGPTQVGGEKFAETNDFTPEDIRFTVSKDRRNLYVIGMKWPQSGSIKVGTLGSENADLSGLKNISLLGSSQTVTCSQDEDGMKIDLPGTNPNGGDYPYVVKLEFAKTVPGLRRNLLSGASITNKGNNWPGCEAEKAIDGDPVSRWANQDENADTWMEIDLGKEETFDRFVMDEYVNMEDPEEYRDGRLLSYTVSRWDGTKWIPFFDSASDEGYRRASTDTDGWKKDDANNLYRNGRDEILKITHTAEFDAVTAQKLRVDFQVRHEISIFEMKLTGSEPEIVTTPVSDIFEDVKEGDWFEDAVQYVYDGGIMTGLDETHFGPAVNLSRGQFATILYRMDGGAGGEAYRADFTDVPDNKELFYLDAVMWASANGIITGYTGGSRKGTFGPADFITREQMAVMMYRYAQYKDYDGMEISDDLKGFPDSGDVSAFAQKEMKWAVGAGLITGNQDTTLAPQGNASRAVCATIIQRFLEKVEK